MKLSENWDIRQHTSQSLRKELDTERLLALTYQTDTTTIKRHSAEFVHEKMDVEEKAKPLGLEATQRLQVLTGVSHPPLLPPQEYSQGKLTRVLGKQTL